MGLEKKKNMGQNIAKIKLIICDVDGVLTDGKIILGNNGEELKAFHVRDGLGINLAQKQGIKFAIITGRISKIVEIRAKELNIIDVYQGIDDKLTVFKKIKKKYDLTESEIAYIGDDVNDIPILKKVGFAVTVADGVNEAKKYSDYITTRKGGQGAVREIIDFILTGGKKNSSK